MRPFALTLALALPALARAEQPITADTLGANAGAWPYQVELVASFQAPGRAQPLSAGTSGVLIRVEDATRARIDFGRDGLYDVPVAATDLVARANAVRRGTLPKEAPNLLQAIGPRLVDLGADPPREVTLAELEEKSLVVALIADPSEVGFPAMARALMAFEGREDLLLVLLGVGHHMDRDIAPRVRGAGWKAPMMLSHLADAYARTLLPAGMEAPALLLQGNEGQLYFGAPWTAETLKGVEGALASRAVARRN
jgi:hypothetical protein